MSDSVTAFHQATITARLPAWSKQLPAHQVERLFNAARKEYLDETGRPHSWYVNADAAAQRTLDEAIERRDASRAALAEALAGLEGITTFCQPRLQQALGIDTPVDVAQYVFQPWEIVTYLDSVHIEVIEGVPREVPNQAAVAKGSAEPRSLLAAALHNFEGLADAGPLTTLQRSLQDADILPGLSLATFIKTCRTLDLGGQYQHHLTQLYRGAQAGLIQQKSTQAARDELRVQAHIAFHRYLLTQAGLDMLLQLCGDDPDASTYAGRKASCRHLELFGTAIHEVLLIGPQDSAQVNPLIVYTPGDPLHPVHEYASAQAYRQALSQTLVQQERLRLFIGYAPQQQQPAFYQTLHQALFENAAAQASTLVPRADRRLRMSEREVALPVWESLHTLHVSRALDDARAIAVPTAQVDAEARMAHLQHWLQRGLDILNVAALFVPGLNGLMLVIGATQVMDEIFEGIRAWEAGNTSEALEHVKSLAINALTVAVIGGAGKALKASGFVDALKEVTVDGQAKLWHPDLAAYRSQASLPRFLEPDATGHYLHEHTRYIRRDGALYETFADASGDWFLRHPQDPHGYAPRLSHNGQGAWRLDLESPLDWDDTQLLRRLGHSVEPIADQDLSMAAQLTGTSAKALRYCHINHTPPPALLADSLLRLRCDNETQQLLNAVRYGKALAAHRNFGVSALVELPEWPEHLQVRVYDGPQPQGSSTLYGSAAEPPRAPLEITRTQLDDGELTDVILRQLDDDQQQRLLPNGTPEPQRSGALRTRLADHLQGKRAEIFDIFYTSQQPSASVQAAALSRQFTGLCPRALEEIVAHASDWERERLAAVTPRVPLRIAEEARLMQAHQRLDRALLGLHRQTLSNADSQSLISGLRAARPELADSPPAQLLKVLLEDRPQAAKLIGQQPVRPGFRSPMRLSEGRIGYPLSGRLLGRLGLDTGVKALQDLYPGLNRDQCIELASKLRARGDLTAQIKVLRQQYTTLDEQLTTWAQAVEGNATSQRQALRRALLSAWKQEEGQTLRLHGFSLKTLPELSVSFEHITRLSISRLGLESLPAGFTDSFPALQRLALVHNPQIHSDALFTALGNIPTLCELDLSSNAITTLPASARQALQAMPRLRSLALHDNGLSLSSADIDTLAGLHLEQLNLKNNTITLDQAMAERFGDLLQLRTLNLENNPLSLAPELERLVCLENLALFGCQLSTWPSGLTTLMERPSSALRIVDLSENQISHIPEFDRVLASPYVQGVSEHRPGQRWHFNFNPLSQEALARLRAVRVSAFQIEGNSVETDDIDWRARGTPAQQERWDALFDERRNPELNTVLQRLGGSAEARRYPETLGSRVWALLDDIAQDTALRERIGTIARDIPINCADGATEAFSDLEEERHYYHETRGAEMPGPYLFNQFRRRLRRAAVNILADRISLQRSLRQTALNRQLPNPPALDSLDRLSDLRLRTGLVDDIEIRLLLRLDLCGETRLNFFEPARDMLYRETAMVDDVVVFNVEERVLKVEARARTRRRWISQQQDWKRYLEAAYPEEIRSLADQWSKGADYLSGVHEDSDGKLPAPIVQALTQALGHSPVAEDGSALPLSEDRDEQSILQAWGSFGAARQKAEEQLLLELTGRVDPND